MEEERCKGTTDKRYYRKLTQLSISIMSLAIGVTLLFFNIMLMFIGDWEFILGGSFIIGIFFIIIAFSRLIIQVFYIKKR